MGCLGGMSRIPYTRSLFYVLFGPIFLYVFLEKDCNGKKKIVVLCLAVIIIAFSREMHSEVLFLPEKPV